MSNPNDVDYIPLIQKKLTRTIHNLFHKVFFFKPEHVMLHTLTDKLASIIMNLCDETCYACHMNMSTCTFSRKKKFK